MAKNLAQSSKLASCTILCKNYFAYALTLFNSFNKHHPDCDFFVLLVERNLDQLPALPERMRVLSVIDLDIPEFQSVAFKYTLLELNTNVKPSLLKAIFLAGAEKIIYFDPDIKVYSSVSFIYDLLEDSDIVLTPHILKPIDVAGLPQEQDFLQSGLYNLGFVALSRKCVANGFLDWWENRCMTRGYNDLAEGLFVDQKWMDLATCLFKSVHILHHSGCDMGYWSLHERLLTKGKSEYLVNGVDTLVFYHFSGIPIDEKDAISKFTTRYTLLSRLDLRDLFQEYRQEVIRNGHEHYKKMNYAFSNFSNGRPVSLLSRRLLEPYSEVNPVKDPFDAGGVFYIWANRERIVGRETQGMKMNRHTFNKNAKSVVIIRWLLRLSLRILGVGRYMMLMKYCQYVGNLRHQKDIFVALNQD